MTLRIIAGRLKGLGLITPSGPQTRPTASLVREALFSMLGGKVVGARVLDMYAGSGAMGLEALSRGALSLTLCDRSHQALAALSANVRRLPLDLKPKILKASHPGSFRTLGPLGPFDLILMDPPYQDPPEIILSFLKRAASTGLATTGATAVWEQATQTLKLWEPPDPWLLISSRNWGERAAAILELAEEEEDKEEDDSAGEDGHNEV